MSSEPSEAAKWRVQATRNVIESGGLTDDEVCERIGSIFADLQGQLFKHVKRDEESKCRAEARRQEIKRTRKRFRACEAKLAAYAATLRGIAEYAECDKQHHAEPCAACDASYALAGEEVPPGYYHDKLAAAEAELDTAKRVCREKDTVLLRYHRERGEARAVVVEMLEYVRLLDQRYWRARFKRLATTKEEKLLIVDGWGPVSGSHIETAERLANAKGEK